MDIEDAKRLLDENPQALGVHDSAVGPILMLPPFRYEPDPPARPPRPRRPEPPVPLPLLATLSWMRGVVTSEAMGIPADAYVEGPWLP